jgi:hypothetical protein
MHMNARTVLALAAIGLAGSALAAHGADASGELAERKATIAKSAATKADLAKEHYLFGVWAREHGFEDDARAEFKAAIAADPSHEASHQALGQVRAGSTWLEHDEAMLAKGLVRRNGAWLLKEEAAILDLPAQERARRAQEQKKVGTLLSAYASGTGAARKFALEALSGVDDKYKLDPLAYALRSRSTDVRLYAAKELGRLADRRALRPLVWRVIHDPDETVRAASLAAAKTIGDPNLVVPFVAALNSDNQQTRMNAAWAVGETGDPIGVRWLVYRFEAHGGGPRVMMSNVQQVSFIQDFDVEVAQTAFIADPQVGTIQEGQVIDVQVVATSEVGEIVEREVVYAALRKLTGATEVKNEKGAWAAWWREHAKEYETASR